MSTAVASVATAIAMAVPAASTVMSVISHDGGA
jgi:hypothetical protein